MAVPNPDILSVNVLFRYNFALFVVASLLVLTGCTTANQQSLGVGVKPAAKTTSLDETAVNTEQPVVDQAGTQTALAPATNETTPVISAASSVANDPAPNVLSRVGFLPITGAPQGAVSRLSRSLGEQAKRHNILVSGSGDRSANYRIKGYMSALNEGSSTTVTFYWDVLDRNGTRLFRINGFERQAGARSDPWSGVSASTYQRIASRTMNDLAVWLKRKGA